MIFLDAAVSEAPSGAGYWIIAVISAVVCLFLIFNEP
jgi:hypothetical protein